MTKFTHPWNVSPAEARDIQNQLRSQVIIKDEFSTLRLVAGVDVGYENNNTITRAAVAVLNYSDLQLVEYFVHRQPTSMPYIPGLLSFREVPAVLAALNGIKQTPDMLLCDGQGIAHPRRVGIACHLGILTGIPAIGVAKSRLIGTHDGIPTEKGDYVPLIHNDELIGAVLCTRNYVKPLYISPGYKVAHQSAIEIVMNCITKYRLPETTRHAHRLASVEKNV